jgi:hypothetical protein
LHRTDKPSFRRAVVMFRDRDRVPTHSKMTFRNCNADFRTDNADFRTDNADSHADNGDSRADNTHSRADESNSRAGNAHLRGEMLIRTPARASHA